MNDGWLFVGRRCGLVLVLLVLGGFVVEGADYDTEDEPYNKDEEFKRVDLKIYTCIRV